MDERDNFDKRCSHNGHGRAYLRLTFLRLTLAFFAPIAGKRDGDTGGNCAPKRSISFNPRSYTNIFTGALSPMQ